MTLSCVCSLTFDSCYLCYTTFDSCCLCYITFDSCCLCSLAFDSCCLGYIALPWPFATTHYTCRPCSIIFDFCCLYYSTLLFLSLQPYTTLVVCDSCYLCYITKEHRSLLQKSPIKHHIRLVLSVLHSIIFAVSYITLDSCYLCYITKEHRSLLQKSPIKPFHYITHPKKT